jgi:hypothetical protein
MESTRADMIYCKRNGFCSPKACRGMRIECSSVMTTLPQDVVPSPVQSLVATPVIHRRRSIHEDHFPVQLSSPVADPARRESWKSRRANSSPTATLAIHAGLRHRFILHTSGRSCRMVGTEWREYFIFGKRRQQCTKLGCDTCRDDRRSNRGWILWIRHLLQRPILCPDKRQHLQWSEPIGRRRKHERPHLRDLGIRC